MKTLFLRMLLCGVSVFLLFITKTNAQYIVNGKEIDTSFNTSMNHIFGNLDKTKIPFGLLRDYAMEFTNLENFNGAALVDSNKLNKGILRQIYLTLATARISSTAYSTLPDPGIIDSLWRIARQPGTVTLSGLFYQYSYLASNADSTGKITVTGDQLFDKYVSGIWQNPYLQDKTVGFAPAGDTYQGKSFNINLPANLWLTNSSSIVSHIEIDAADGLGYRTLTPGTNLAVSYADTGMKTLNFKLFLTDASILQSHTQLHVIQDPLTLFGGFETLTGPSLSSHGVTPRSETNTYNITSTATFGGVAGNGVISVQLANGHTSLVKPMIVVEGFDPGIYTTPENTTGEYSYGDFIVSVINSRSDALKNLISNTATAQYDIVFIDFKNGTDYIHRNALVVEDVIRWVNANKTGANQNVVLGLSMGGLCARYALKTMENASETHDTRLFISHGTPEQGVVVPLAYQYLENHVNSFYMRSGVVSGAYNIVQLIDNSLPNIDGLLSLTDSPAAVQMLVNRIDDSFNLSNSAHNTWQSELTTLGYPSQGGIRNVAISNGSECGQPQPLAQGSQLLYLDGKFNTSFLGDLLGILGSTTLATLTWQPAFLLSVVPGRNDILVHFQLNAAEDGGGNQAYNGKITYKKTILWLIPVNITLTNRTFNTPSGVLPLETFAGDYYAVPVKSSNFASSGWFGKYNVTLNINPNFGFVPTPSALDIGHGSTTLTEGDYSLSYSGLSLPATPKNTPFASFITAYTPITTGAPNNNEGHITYTTRNGNWLASELQASPAPSGCDIFCSNNSITGAFNVCGPATYSVTNSTAATYSWSVSSNLQIVSGGTTNAAVIQAASTEGNGPGTITLTMSDSPGSVSGCGPVTIQKDVQVGCVPIDGFIITQADPSAQFTANSFGNTMMVTPWPMPDVTYLEWGYTNYLYNDTEVENYGGTYLQDYIFPNSGTYLIYARPGNSYGLGPAQTTEVYVADFGGFDFLAYPNPAGSFMTITTAPGNNAFVSPVGSSNFSLNTTGSGNKASSNNAATNKTAPANQTANAKIKRAFTYKIYNKLGVIVKQGSTPGGTDATVDVHDLPADTYFLHVFIDKKKIVKQIIVSH